jgi:hypothetical protein
VTGTGKSLSIIDVEGIGARDAAGGVLASIKRVSGLTQRHYPNRAYMIFIINTPFWFSSIWKVISPLLNEHTRNKVKICRGLSTYQDLLLEQIESANLPRIYGGTCDCKDCTRDSPLERELWDYVAALPVAQEGKTQPPQESKSATNTAAAAAAVQPGVVLLSTAEDEDEDEELPVKRLG